MNIRLLFTALIVALTVSPFTARAADEAAATAQPGVGAASLITLSATVTAVDQEARQVTLKDADGNTQVITVGDDVKNLAQVAVGDQLDVTYFESITFEVLPPGQTQTGVAGSSAMETAEPGQKPGAAATASVAVVATVEAIDKTAQTIALKGPEGNVKTVKVRDPDNLDKVVVGDHLLITVTKAIAVGVSAAPENQ